MKIKRLGVCETGNNFRYCDLWRALCLPDLDDFDAAARPGVMIVSHLVAAIADIERQLANPRNVPFATLDLLNTENQQAEPCRNTAMWRDP
jgi:hypothetical protein